MRNNEEVSKETGSSRSLDRIHDVVELVTMARDGVTLAEIMRDTAIPRSTLYVMLQSLVDQGIVKRRAGGLYTAGPALVRWGARAISALDLVSVARPWMTRLAQQTGYVVNLARMDDDRRRIVFVAKEEAGLFRTTAQVGSKAPLYSTALGKVLLAYAPMEWRGTYLVDTPLAARTPYTLTQPEQLAEALYRVRERGWAEDHQENELGVCAVAAPVRDYTGHVVAALSVAIPDTEFESVRVAVIDETRLTAARISHELGAEVSH